MYIFRDTYLILFLPSFFRNTCLYSVYETKRPQNICGNVRWSIIVFSVFVPPSKALQPDKISSEWAPDFATAEGRNFKIRSTPGHGGLFNLKGGLLSDTPVDNHTSFGRKTGNVNGKRSRSKRPQRRVRQHQRHQWRHRAVLLQPQVQPMKPSSRNPRKPWLLLLSQLIQRQIKSLQRQVIILPIFLLFSQKLWQKCTLKKGPAGRRFAFTQNFALFLRLLTVTKDASQYL